jgi:hypothetical protein
MRRLSRKRPNILTNDQILSYVRERRRMLDFNLGRGTITDGQYDMELAQLRQWAADEQTRSKLYRARLEVGQNA